MNNRVDPFKRYPDAFGFYIVPGVFGILGLKLLGGAFRIGFGGGYNVFLVCGKSRQLLLKHRGFYVVFPARFDFFDSGFNLVQSGKNKFYRFIIEPYALFFQGSERRFQRVRNSFNVFKFQHSRGAF